MIAISGLNIVLQIWILHSRQGLRLGHASGTIASALAVSPPISHILSGHHTENDLKFKLRGMWVKWNQDTGKIEITEGRDYLKPGWWDNFMALFKRRKFRTQGV